MLSLHHHHYHIITIIPSPPSLPHHHHHPCITTSSPSSLHHHHYHIVTIPSSPSLLHHHHHPCITTSSPSLHHHHYHIVTIPSSPSLHHHHHPCITTSSPSSLHHHIITITTTSSPLIPDPAISFPELHGDQLILLPGTRVASFLVEVHSLYKPIELLVEGKSGRALAQLSSLTATIATYSVSWDKATRGRYRVLAKNSRGQSETRNITVTIATGKLVGLSKCYSDFVSQLQPPRS